MERLAEMSVEIRAAIICDSCGERIDGPLQTRTSQCGCESYNGAKRKARKQHWMFNQRYGKTKHLCQLCADSVPGEGHKFAQKVKRASQKAEGSDLFLG